MGRCSKHAGLHTANNKVFGGGQYTGLVIAIYIRAHCCCGFLSCITLLLTDLQGAVHSRLTGSDSTGAPTCQARASSVPPWARRQPLTSPNSVHTPQIVSPSTSTSQLGSPPSFASTAPGGPSKQPTTPLQKGNAWGCMCCRSTRHQQP
jgi:hypothetical protein